jgi:hypothetical protein
VPALPEGHDALNRPLLRYGARRLATAAAHGGAHEGTVSIDRFKTHGDPGDQTNFVLRDPEYLYTHSEVCDLLERAEELGFSLEKGSELEGLTVGQLEQLVKVRQ